MQSMPIIAAFFNRMSIAIAILSFLKHWKMSLCKDNTFILNPHYPMLIYCISTEKGAKSFAIFCRVSTQCHWLWCRSHKFPKGGFILLTPGNAEGIPGGDMPLPADSTPRVGCIDSWLAHIYAIRSGVAIWFARLSGGARSGATTG